MNVVIVHDVVTAFGSVGLIHVFENDKGFEALEFFVLLELFVD